MTAFTISTSFQCYTVGSSWDNYVKKKTGGRDQKDRASKPSWAKSSVRPYLEKSLHKKWLVEWLNFLRNPPRTTRTKEQVQQCGRT
jgi:hypothetical protein